jgi:hypothetical protein
MTAQPPKGEPDPATEPHTDAQATAPTADAWANRVETDIDSEHVAKEQRKAIQEGSSAPPSG